MAKTAQSNKPETSDETATVETPALAKKAEPKRKVLTAAERVAKLEAELEAARKKASDKAEKESAQLSDRRKVLVERRDLLNKQIEEIDVALENLKPVKA